MPRTSTRKRPSTEARAGRGWSALASGRWAEARRNFLEMLDADETPEALEGLSWAAWWLDDAEGSFESREAAYRKYRARGDAGDAARMAVWLAADHIDFHGALAVARGWLRRARRLLAPLDASPDHGWLAFHEGYAASLEGDGLRGSRLAAEATRLGRRFRIADLEMLGLALRGVTLVARTEMSEGMGCLDEAAAAALAGDVAIPISRAWTCCFLVSACQAVRDYRRAFEWCDRIAEFARRYDSRYMLGFCRARYGELHTMRGHWREAATELEGAIEAYARSRPPLVSGAVAALAELRRRQGRAGEAERLLDEYGASALLCRAKIALDWGDARAALEGADRLLRQVPAQERLRRVSALELVARAGADSGELRRAAAAAGELGDIARAVGTVPLLAGAALAAGIVAAGQGAFPEARVQLEDAIDGFERADVPFEAGQARVALATTLLAMGRRDDGTREARRALAIATALGAETEARRARRLIDDAPSGSVLPPSTPPVTRRELEVLRHLAEGCTNRQIASRLGISEHTAHRHVTNILRKLDLPSRAAAAAHAVRAGLIPPDL